MTRGFSLRTSGRTNPSEATQRQAATLRAKAREIRRQVEHHVEEARRLTVQAEQIERSARELDGGS